MPGVPFTKENAQEMQKRAQLSREARIDQLRKALDDARKAPGEFRDEITMSTRAQMRIVSEKIDKALERSTLDHKELTALAATLATFEAIEQKLSMRAGPGNLKPTAERKPRAGGFVPPPRPADDDGHG